MASQYFDRPLRTLTAYRDELAAAVARMPPGSVQRDLIAGRLADVECEIAALRRRLDEAA